MERGAVISTEQAWQLAYRWFSTRLSPDWKRYTLDESQDLLESLGLTGPFWNLRG
jgi:hypothetical protein